MSCTRWPPIPIIHGVVTPISRVSTLFTHWFSAIYRGPITPEMVGAVGAHLVAVFSVGYVTLRFPLNICQRFQTLELPWQRLKGYILYLPETPPNKISLPDSRFVSPTCKFQGNLSKKTMYKHSYPQSVFAYCKEIYYIILYEYSLIWITIASETIKSII